MRHFLMKSEPETYSIRDLARDGKTMWEGVRNFQARNLMRDEMKIGDLVLFYHSSAEPTGVAGIGRVCSAPYPDATQFVKKSPYYDATAKADDPRWILVDVEHVETFPGVVTLETIKADPKLAGIHVTRKGNRLSVQPVEPAHFDRIVELKRTAPKSTKRVSSRRRAR
jgi:predicted RNA-binding protein with PUA-like domain